MGNNIENEYGFGEEKKGLKPIRDEEIEGLLYHIEGNYRIFEKVCSKCNKNYTTSVPEDFFHKDKTLPPNQHRNNILEVIKKKFCESCELQLKE